jgi:putative aminopeptidase FrvX
MSDHASLLRELSEVHGVSGFEAQVAAVVRRELEPICEITADRLGSVICRLRSSGPGPRVVLAGHADEIGFMVKLITKEGFVKFQNLGGWWDQVLLGQRVVIETRHGARIVGVIGAKPPHLLPEDKRNAIVKADDMFIDIGASSKEDVEGLGIRPGDSITPASEYCALSVDKRILGKAWDDRAGVALLVHTLQALAGTALGCELYGVATSQEEVGLRGATTSAHATGPDVALIMETAIAGDVPGITEDESSVKLGGGPTIYLMDGSMIAQTRLRDLVLQTAEEEGIPYQFALLARGGTDGGRYHLNASGTPSIVFGVPTRHIHSHAGIIDLDDYDNTLKLVCKVVEGLNAESVAALTEL